MSLFCWLLADLALEMVGTEPDNFCKTGDAAVPIG